VVVGGIIPPEDAETLKALGVAAVYTPKNFQLTGIMADIVRIVDLGTAKAAGPAGRSCPAGPSTGRLVRRRGAGCCRGHSPPPTARDGR
jgi:hypothetical protein